MTGIYFCIVRQGEELRLNTIYQNIHTSAWQIGAAHTTAEQYITANYETASFMIKRNAAR